MPDSTAVIDSTTAAGATRRPPVVVLSASAPVSGDGEASTLAVVVGVDVGVPAPSDPVVAACAGVGIDLGLLLAAEDAKVDAGSAIVVPLARAEAPGRLVVVGVGEGRPADWRAAGATTARRSNGRRTVVVGVPGATNAGPGCEAGAPAALRSFGEGVALGAYRQPTAAATAGSVAPSDPAVNPADEDVAELESIDLAGLDPAGLDPADREPVADALGGNGRDGKGALREVVLVVPDPLAPELVAALGAADVVGRAVHLARDLVNTTADVATPAWLAARAVELGAEAGFGVRVLGPAELVEGGFGGLLAVGHGAVNPPRLVVLSYEGPASGSGSAAASLGHRVLVGKGVTFDTGGLSLKPTSSMVGMKTDMAGSAAVLATMTTLAKLGAPGRVTGLMCLAENAFGAAAMRPGDVITCYGGTTVEVLNTDAEGRLVLADGLAYAAANLAPDVMVDLATLTGAISVALGRRTAGMFATDDKLAEALAAASERGGERVWRLPLVEDYRPAITSPVADLANTGRYLDVNGGSITAALFLREFVGGVPWAHFDIAGTARSDSDDGEISRGGTGWGVRTLVSWLTAAG